MRFTKMHGAGNDYVYVDGFSEVIPDDVAALARAVSDRHTGVGGDGLILILPADNADARMRMFNLDGSEGEMCGNAIRCVGKYLYDHGRVTQEQIRVETGRGVLTLQLFPENGKVQRVRVNMGAPIFEPDLIPTTLSGTPPTHVPLEVAGKTLQVTAVSMGNPHCVIFVDELHDDWVHGLGPQIEHHPAFPRRVNVEFVQVLARDEIAMRVWERGSGETQACGTGASASLVACVLNGLTDRQVTCHLPGGDLTLEWEAGGDVYKTGPAVEVFSGDWNSEQS